MTDKAARDDVVMVPAEDAAMSRAIARARETLPGFFEIMAQPEPGMSSFAVKVAVQTPTIIEQIWLLSPRIEGRTVVGVVSNTPAHADDIERGQMLTVPRGAVTDWTYQSSGRMIGNYTACALASRTSPQEAAEFQRRYRIDCSK